MWLYVICTVCHLCGIRNDVHKSLQNGCTALMLASRYGLSEFVKELLKMDVQVNAQQEVGAV